MNSVPSGFDMSCTHENNVASSISKAAGPGTMKSMKYVTVDYDLLLLQLVVVVVVFHFS